jgi:acyl carrier protein
VNRSSLSLPAQTVLANDEEAGLRDSLKRCSPATFEAVQKFRQTGDLVHLPVIVHGVIARYVEPDLRLKLSDHADALRLNEDLGLDSLTMMEIVLLAEEVLKISISYEELCHLRTVGDVCQFLVFKVRNPLSATPTL